MEKHPIESLMGVSMEQIKDMVDVNTVIGDAVQTQDGSTIIPISRVSFISLIISTFYYTY